MLDVLPDHFLVSTVGRDKVAARPEALPNVVLVERRGALRDRDDADGERWCRVLSIAAARPIIWVAERLGHSSVEVTLRNYAHFMPRKAPECRALAEALGATYAYASGPEAFGPPRGTRRRPRLPMFRQPGGDGLVLRRQVSALLNFATRRAVYACARLLCRRSPHSIRRSCGGKAGLESALHDGSA